MVLELGDYIDMRWWLRHEGPVLQMSLFPFPSRPHIQLYNELVSVYSIHLFGKFQQYDSDKLTDNRMFNPNAVFEVAKRV